jgi:two-component system, NtrC family, response regulator AtoC
MTRKAHFRVLAVDDDPLVLVAIRALLSRPDREVVLAHSTSELEDFYAQLAPDVVLLDYRLQDGDGLELLPTLKARWPAAQIILMSGYATTEVIVEAIKRGAYHFKTKPFSGDDLRYLVDTACALKTQTQSAPPAFAETADGRTVPWPVAQSPGMKEVLRLTARVATNDVSILITGESGTGKEVIADLVHKLSVRAHGPMVTVNCAALPRELIEAELFGVIKGAYTGAVANRRGLFSEAAGGTLFLDEIAEMPVQTQAKLLRVLQQREFRPVGGLTNLKAECRILAATNRDPELAIKEGLFRADLYYRIGAITIHLPPLRERPEDILPLANLFIERHAAEAGWRIEGLTDAAARRLEQFNWPGNVRQLENELQRAVLLCEGKRIDVQDLAIGATAAKTPALSEPETESRSRLEQAEKAVILAELQAAGGNKRAVAEKLNIARQTLYNKLRYYGIGEGVELPKAAPGEPELPKATH